MRKTLPSILILIFITSQLAMSQDTTFVYLSDFVISKNKVNYHDVGVGLDYPWNYPEKKLSLDGVEYNKGVGTMTGWNDSYLEYDLNKQFLRFEAIVGLDDISLLAGEDQEFANTFEWLLIDTAGNTVRQYRGCKGKELSDNCDEIDLNVPYWPGNDDKNNEWVDYYVANSPDRRIVMTRPACQARVLLDGEEEFHTGNMTKSENYSTAPDTIELDLTGKGKLTLDMIADGIQYGPFEEPTLVKSCPWRDRIDWVDAKLYYIKSVKGIEVVEDEIIMDPENTAYVEAEVSPFNAIMDAYKIESLHPDIVEVKDEYEGRLWSKKPGKATIKVTSIDGGYQDSCIVEVRGEVHSSIQENISDGFIINNPASADNITINLNVENNVDMTIQIFDLSGKCVWNKKNTHDNSMSLNLKGILNKGMYIVNVLNNKTFYTSKLIITK